MGGPGQWAQGRSAGDRGRQSPNGYFLPMIVVTGRQWLRSGPVRGVRASGRPALPPSRCVTPSRSPALFRCLPPSSDCKRLQRTLGHWASCPRSLTQGREPREQPAVTSSGKGISPSGPDSWDHQEAWGGVWAGAGGGVTGSPSPAHCLTNSQKHPVTPSLNKRLLRPRVSSPGSMVLPQVPMGRWGGSNKRET